MKKSLFALAAVTAFAGAAQAQSSVTVYGILDIGVGGYNTRAATGAVTTPAVNGVNKSTGTVAFDGGESTNRLGFKGTEDLGNGTSAFFTIELGLSPDSAALISPTAATANSTQNRQSFVGLKKNGLGDIALGTQYTNIHNAVAKTDAGNQNNMVGDLIYAKSTGATAGAGNTAGDSYTVRANQMITLNSEVLSGFQAHAMAILNNNNTTQSTTVTSTSNTVSGGVNNQNGWGLGLDYTWNKLFLTANYMGLTAKNSYTDTTSNGAIVSYTAGTPAYFGVGQSGNNGTNVQDNQAYIAGTYDFGILKAYAQYVTRKVMAQQDNNYYVKRNAEQIGVRSFITPTIEAWAQGGLGRITSNGGGVGYGQPTANLTAWQIGSNYWLSKRTNLYAIYGQVGTSNVSATVNGNPVSGNANNYGVGVRHTF